MFDGSSRRKTLILIPARMESKRLPGKPMLKAAGRALVHWTYLQAKKTRADHVIVATDSQAIARYCHSNGLVWMSSSSSLPNGTSRCHDVYMRMRPEVRENTRTVVNWQVDEPCINPAEVDLLLDQRIGTIGTLVYPKCPVDADSNHVRVVYSKGKCHWFSRAPMAGSGTHIGIYSFCPFLLQMVSLLEISKYASMERLEQLTWVENGMLITPTEVAELPLAINTKEDWIEFKKMKEAA